VASSGPAGAVHEKLILRNFLSPGDILVMSAALDALHRAYPGRYRTAVECACPAIYENNPYVSPLNGNLAEWTTVQMHYPLIHECNGRPVHFLDGYVDFLSKFLELNPPLRTMTNRPLLYLSPQEKGWTNQVEERLGRPQRYWVINSGTKGDFTAKHWGTHNYQRVVDLLRDRIFFVQVGEAGHNHQPLDGVLNLVGQTDPRQLIRLVYHADGGLGPSTFLQHIAAAWQKPYVAIVGGREPKSWLDYPSQSTLSTQGQLPCCRDRGCWKSRTVTLNDGDEKDKSLCEMPVTHNSHPAIPKCLDMITPRRVVDEILAFYEGGVLAW
jgi:ADP-heptose:LPS heptosyltransferase